MLTMDLDAEQILQTARQSEEPPQGWTVIPLDEKTVKRAILNWIGSAIVGVGLFGLLFAAVHDDLTFFPLFLLAVLAFVGGGSLWLVLKNVRLLTDKARQLIVMTPENYVQQRGARIIVVPMSEISHITLRGVFGGDASYSTVDDRDLKNAVMGVGQMFGGGARPRRARRTPDSLAFVDARDDSPVVIAEDNSFAELPVLEELLRTYVDNARRVRKS